MADLQDTGHLLASDLEADQHDQPEPRLSQRQIWGRVAIGAVFATALVAASRYVTAGGGAETLESGWEHSKPLIERDTAEADCAPAKESSKCAKNIKWAKSDGISQHPDWYLGLTADSPDNEFQALLWHKKLGGCSDSKPCDSEALLKKIAKSEKVAKKAEEEAEKNAPPPGPRAQTFYMYRAQSEATYPLENINTADLAGVFWYLHNEVIVASPRKYRIDRIKRYKVTTRNTWEFWNTHKRQFSAFVAYDAGGCTTPICKDIYHQYGFVVGCQVQSLTVASYLGKTQTNWNCKAGEDQCRAPVWYSLPGPCPAKGIPNGAIHPNAIDLDVNKYKTPECIERMPGGHCAEGDATGDPTCTYSYEPAGEIFLNDLVGIEDYNQFWNVSYTDCVQANPGDPKACRHNKEYDPHTDKGVGTDFWNGMHDEEKCTERLDKARALFKKNFPDMPEHLPEPACEFDMYYDGEFDWKINHTGAETSSWWENRM